MRRLRVGDEEKGDGSGVHDHRVFSMLFGLRGWSWGKVRVMVVVSVIVRVRVMGIVRVRLMVRVMLYGYLYVDVR